jgi:hypothetical protein
MPVGSFNRSINGSFNGPLGRSFGGSFAALVPADRRPSFGFLAAASFGQGLIEAIRIGSVC